MGAGGQSPPAHSHAQPARGVRFHPSRGRSALHRHRCALFFFLRKAAPRRQFGSPSELSPRRKRRGRERLVEPLTSTVEPLTSTVEPLTSTVEPLTSTVEPLTSTEKKAPGPRAAR
eukprot:1192208-Prorocentrum_minimum.AAC.11